MTKRKTRKKPSKGVRRVQIKKIRKPTRQKGIYYVRVDDRFVVEDVPLSVAEREYEKHVDLPGVMVTIIGYVDRQGYGRIIKTSHRGMVTIC